KQARYWREELKGAPAVLELPADRRRPAEQDYAGDAVGVELDAELTRGLRGLSRSQGATLYMTLMAGWAVLLARLSGQEEAATGRRRGIEGLIGFVGSRLGGRLEV